MYAIHCISRILLAKPFLWVIQEHRKVPNHTICIRQVCDLVAGAWPCIPSRVPATR